MPERRAPATAGVWEAAGLALVLLLLSLLRPVDHDESQYVAAATLVADGLRPYRDFVYLQTPLQPWLFAPIAWAASLWTWPALRVVNALLGAGAVVAAYRASLAAGATPRAALRAAGAFLTCDALLFSTGTARNDALPVALYSVALALALAPMPRKRLQAATIGLLLASAAAAKVSYALPAAAYGLYALVERGHRPLWVAAGSLPVVAFVLWSWSASPGGFLFGTLVFPSEAPLAFYAARPWKLSLAAKLLDTIKFLALGPALLVAALVARGRRHVLLDLLIVAGLAAALLPTPTWRQYLLPMLPPLFIRAALMWSERPPLRMVRVALIIVAAAGLAPSLAAVIGGGTLFVSLRAGRSVGQALDAVGYQGPVATLSPQVLPATGRRVDPRFAAGPFAFRYKGGDPATRGYVAANRVFFEALPDAILTGGEDRWTGGDPQLDATLADAARLHGRRRLPVAPPFTLWIRPPSRALRPPAPGNRP